jgi:hypothetical protein
MIIVGRWDLERIGVMSSQRTAQRRPSHGAFRLLRVWITRALLLAALSSQAWAGGETVSLPKSEKDAQILRVFTGKSGQIVFAYRYKKDGQALYDFYDTASGRKLSPDTELHLATDSALEAKIIRDNSLTMVRSADKVTSVPGQILSAREFTGTTCDWPYSVALDVTSNRGKSASFVLLKKRARPAPESYERGCEGVTGTYSLKARYLNLVPRFYSIAGTAYVLLWQEPAFIRASALRAGPILSVDPDLLLVPATIVERGFEKANSSGPRQQQAMDKLDSIISTYAAQTSGDIK